MRSSAIVNPLKDGLDRGEFLVTLEYCPPPRGESLASLEAIAEYAASAPNVHAVALTDRVTSDTDYDPVDIAPDVLRRSGKVPLVHLSGKDFTPATFEARLRRCADEGLDNVLVVTGDMPRPATPGELIIPENGFVDSVHGVHIANAVGRAALIAAAVTTFKYTEAELMGQYIKMNKKMAHGAQLIFNQVGYDLRKAQELIGYGRHSGNPVQAMAALYWLAPGFARFALAGNVPGVLTTEDLCRRLEEICQESDKGMARRTEMMALHIVLCKRFGYRGVHVGGIKKPDSFDRVLKMVDDIDKAGEDVETLWQRWCEHCTFNDGRPVEMGQPGGFYLFEPDGHGLNAMQLADPGTNGYASPRYAFLRFVHDLVFAKGLRPGGLGDRFVRGLARVPGAKPVGYVLERMVKTPLVGCEGCGSCSLPDTEYVCIEGKCAKHLPNGPCGGQRDGQCEAYPDRQCAWVEIYKRAKSQGNLEALQSRFVLPKDHGLKGTCSWMNLCLGLDHHAADRKTG